MRIRSNEVARDGRRPAGKKNARFLGALFAVSVVAAFSLGCSATVTAGVPTVAGHQVAAVDAVPAGLEAHPRAFYRGEYAYLINGQWYYPTASGWVVFLDEPRELASVRMHIETAPGRRAPAVEYGYPTVRPVTPPREIHREYRPR